MDKKISNIKERILYLADFKGIAKEKFFTEIGMTYGNFKGKQKNTALNSDALDRILSIHPDVDALWLITGNGSVVVHSSENDAIVVNRFIFFIHHKRFLTLCWLRRGNYAHFI